MTNPLCDPYLILNKVYCGGKYLKQAIAETPVEPINKARTVKICYGVLEKDVYLSYLIEKNVKKQPKAAIKIILKIALYMLEFMQKHDYMVVDGAVELTKKLGKDGAAGFVNAFLRSYKIPPLPEKVDEALSVKCSAPLWLVKKIKRSYKGEAEAILTASSLGVCVRFKSGEEEYLCGEHQVTPFKKTYIFKNFTRDINFSAGNYTFQSVGSVAICNAVAPCEKFLDACAAPGGKSVLIAEKCQSVVSCELHEHRFELIRSYIRRMDAKNVAPVLCDSSQFNREWEEVFDGVLCDVPCSGTGVINENPDIKLFRKQSDIEELNKIQSAILNNCAKYVKPGGTLYYSTCSVLPEENDSVIYNFLQNHSEYTLTVPNSPLKCRRTNYGLQFLPHISMGAGFFMTAMVKSL